MSDVSALATDMDDCRAYGVGDDAVIGEGVGAFVGGEGPRLS